MNDINTDNDEDTPFDSMSNTFGAHTYLFDELQLDWDDNNDWTWGIIDYDNNNQHLYRFNTKCTQIIPFIHQHICLHISNDHDAMVFFQKAKENEIDKFYASAYIAYNDDNLLFDDFEDEEDEEEDDNNANDEDIVQLALTQFDTELFTLNEDSSFMDEWHDNEDGSEWIVSNEAVSSFYDYQWELCLQTISHN